MEIGLLIGRGQGNLRQRAIGKASIRGGFNKVQNSSSEFSQLSLSVNDVLCTTHLFLLAHLTSNTLRPVSMFDWESELYDEQFLLIP